MPLQKAEALFGFQPTAAVELELKKGDIVLVRRTSVGEGWWEGELNGKRGLFPSSFVKMLPQSAGGSPVMEKPKTPLTPLTSKKAFMETLLTPATNTQEQIYDKDKALDLFVQGHSDISITAGPRWDCYPPTLTVVIKDLHTQTRFSGVKHFTVFDVETRQLGTQVTRRYKNFLWLYDKMAELFPCVSLPPLPVKQFSGLEEHGIEARRRGLENFLNRVANHPVLGSTKLLHDFLTQKEDKDWKIGRHLSNIKLPKSAKKLFNAPVYSTVKYPPFNVPINQLASIEKFSRFSRLMELNVQAVQQSCKQLCHSDGEMMSSVNRLGKDFQRMARGIQPTIGVQRRKLVATPSHPGNLTLSVPNGQTSFHLSNIQRAPSEIEEEDSEEEMDSRVEWNWRSDSKFNCMMTELYDIAGGMKKLSNLYHTHRESVERNVLDSLADYVGIIHTLPMMVRLHEEAMETYNASKDKDTKKEAEEVRQHCETLNNIILAEFDFFSKTMVDDFENVTLNLLKQQADFHRQLANEWDSLYQRYTNRRSSRRPQESERITSSGKSFSFDKSGSFTGSFTSSHTSSASYGIPERESDQDSTLTQSLPTDISKGNIIPTYINVERMDSKKRSDSWEKIDEEELMSPSERAKSSAKKESDHLGEVDLPEENSQLYESVIVHQSEDTLEESLPQKEQDEIHSYANIEFSQAAGSTVVQPKIKSAPGSPKKLKKPMPIRRKQTSSECEATVSQESSLSSSQEVCSAIESSSSPKIKAKIPMKPPPPAKPLKLTSTPLQPHSMSPKTEEERPLFSTTPILDQLVEKLHKSSPEKTNPNHHTNSDLNLVPSEMKPRSRSKTTLETIQDRKQPLLPPSNKPLPLKSTQPLSPPGKKREATGSTVHHPALKPKLSEPANTGRAKTMISLSRPQITPPTSPPSDEPAHKGRDELMRKLSLRRQRIEQQLGIHKPGSKLSPQNPNIGNIAEAPSERNSTVSTSSSHSEVVVAYSTRRADDSSGSMSSNGTVNSNDAATVTPRKHTEDDNLTKFGIIEDTEGGSFVI